MDSLARVVGAIERINEQVGRAVSWLTLAMVLIAFAVVAARYGFSWGRVWLQESFVWLHGVVFMLGAGYTLAHDGHVRVDVFYRSAGRRYQAWVDLIGGLLLLAPMVLVVLTASLPYVADSWGRLEQSREAGGLPGLFLLKTAIPVFCLLLLAQGLALAGRSILVLAGHPSSTPPAGCNEPG